MGGGLMQLVAYGAQDIYLTGNPQITFFKVVYRRHTNFSMETISQSFDGNSSLGSSQNEASCTIGRNGDLIYKMYIAVLKANSAHIDHGSNIIVSSQLEIGGQEIDKHTGEWNNIWNELSTPDSKTYGLMAMQSDSGIAGGDVGVGMVQVPLNFWFCRNPGLALPLIALQYHEVKINFVFNSFKNVRSSEFTTDIPIKFYVDYIYLDTDERRRFAQVSHEYLIEQVQMQSLSSDKSQELTFNHPVKELIWTGNQYESAILKLNGLDRFEKQEIEYFQLRQPFDYHTSVPRMNLTTGVAASLGGTNLGPNLLATSPLVLKSKDLSGGSAVLTSGEFTIIKADGAQISNASGLPAHGTDEIFYTFRKSDMIDGFTTDMSLLIVMNGTLAGHDADHPLEQTSATVEVFSDGLVDAGQGELSGINANNTTLQFYHRFEHITTELASDSVVAENALNITSMHAMGIGGLTHSHTSKFNKQINVYSFALSPEDHQPSGTCNFSRIDTAQLVFGAPLSTSNNSSNNIYAVNYNILRIMSGMGGLAYSN